VNAKDCNKTQLFHISKTSKFAHNAAGLKTFPTKATDLRFPWKFINCDTKILDTVSLQYFYTISYEFQTYSLRKFCSYNHISYFTIVCWYNPLDVSQVSTLSSSLWALLCNVVMSSWDKCKLKSFAKSVVWKLEAHGRSLTQIKNSKEPITDPWRTPHSIFWNFFLKQLSEIIVYLITLLTIS